MAHLKPPDFAGTHPRRGCQQVGEPVFPVPIPDTVNVFQIEKRTGLLGAQDALHRRALGDLLHLAAGIRPDETLLEGFPEDDAKHGQVTVYRGR